MTRVATITIALLLGCSTNAADAPAATPTAESPEPTPNAPEPDGIPAAEGTEMPSLSTSDCEAQGGSIVGDIGDGAIFKADYKCESGHAPAGRIEAEAGAPIAVEGSVCCI